MAMGKGVSGEVCLGRTPRVLYAYTHITDNIYIYQRKTFVIRVGFHVGTIYISIERVGRSEIRCVHGSGGVNVKSHPLLVHAKVQ